MFKAEKWNPDQWVELFQQTGAKYVISNYHPDYIFMDGGIGDGERMHGKPAGVIFDAVGK